MHTETKLAPLDVQKLREEFPTLRQRPYGKALVYLDNAATTQKPQIVLDIVNGYYATANSNVHRGIHYLSEKATRAFEDSRVTAQKFLNAADPSEIIFVRGTTEAINLVASS